LSHKFPKGISRLRRRPVAWAACNDHVPTVIAVVPTKNSVGRHGGVLSRLSGERLSVGRMFFVAERSGDSG